MLAGSCIRFHDSQVLSGIIIDFTVLLFGAQEVITMHLGRKPVSLLQQLAAKN